MISIHQFKRMSLEEKLLAVDCGGIDLSMALFKENESSMLFSLHLFYVEVSFNKSSGCIKTIRCFTTVRKLTPYLAQINIDDLTNLLSTSPE